MHPIFTKIKFVLLALIVFFIPCYLFQNHNLAPLCIILFSVAWVLEGKLIEKFNSWRRNKYALLFTGFYLLYALGLLYTSDLKSGEFTLQVKLSMGIFPLLLVSDGELAENKKRILMWAFISGCVIKGLYCLGYASWNYYATGVAEFSYSKFSEPLHPSYYTMYINLALLFIFYMVTSAKQIIGRKEKIGLLFIALFLLFLIIRLESKAGWITTGLLFIALLIKLFSIKTYRKVAIAISCAGLAVIVLLNHGVSRFTMVKTLMASGKMDSTSGESTQSRYYAWKAAKQLIAEKPLIGYGTGRSWEKLQDQYLKMGYIGPQIKKINAHNQYLETAIDIGLVGLLYMILCFILPLIYAIRKKQFIYGAFLCILLLNIVVESMFEQQAGTLFYGVFNSLLMFNFAI